MRELTLLHHYMTDASTTLGENRASARYLIWSQKVVKLGLQYPFLLRAVLSVSALRLAKTESSHEWFVESTKHIEAGLKIFRPLVTDAVDEQLQSALFAFSSLLVVQNFGVAMVETPANPIAEIIKCMRLVRGVSVILKNAWEAVQNAELGPLLAVVDYNPDAEDLDDVFLSQLKSMIETSSEDVLDRTALVEAVDQLRKIAAQHSAMKKGINEAYASSLSILLSWPVSIPERAIELMAARNIHALCILAYFPRILATSGPHWWLSGWDRLLLDAILPQVPQGLGEWLSSDIQTAR